MDKRWIGVADAAKKLGVSERTIWRRISRGAYETRESGDGRREILADVAPTASDVFSDAVSILETQGSNQMSAASAAVGQAREALKDSREQIETIRGDLREARRWGRCGWGLTFLLLVAGGAGVWFAGRELATADVTLRHERQQAGQLAERAGRLTVDLDGAKAELADVSGELAGVTVERDTAVRTRDKLSEDLQEAQAEAVRLRAEADVAVAEEGG